MALTELVTASNTESNKIIMAVTKFISALCTKNSPPKQICPCNATNFQRVVIISKDSLLCDPELPEVIPVNQGTDLCQIHTETCLVPCLDEFKCQGQMLKIKVPGAKKRAVYSNHPLPRQR